MQAGTKTGLTIVISALVTMMVFVTMAAALGSSKTVEPVRVAPERAVSSAIQNNVDSTMKRRIDMARQSTEAQPAGESNESNAVR